MTSMAGKKLRLNIGGDGKLSVASSSQSENSEGGTEEAKRKICLGGKVVSSADGSLHFDIENRFEDSDVFFEDFLEKITSMGLTGKNTDMVVQLSKNLIKTHTKLVLKLLESDGNGGAVEIINETSEHMSKQLEQIETDSKRLKGISQKSALC